MIEYKKVKRKVSVGSNPGEKFYADIVRGQTVELDEIYKDMTDLASPLERLVRSVMSL